MAEKERSDEELDLGDLAKRALERIVNLSQSQIISEKLQSLNILLFVFILTSALTHYLGGASTAELSLLFIIALSFIFALVVSLGYAMILSAVTNVSPNKIESLRIGIVMLFIALTLGVAGFAFDVKLLTNSSLGLTALQLIIIPMSGFLLPRISVEDRKIEPGQVWIALGRISSIVGIVSFIIDVALLLFRPS
ncbi:MAG: hypothetical protein OEZ29_01610 [Candidatus Bathyarchaeota archaeon]|nr:hypothetical protein [Candidatus Bathyarchaeota archaeon]